MSDTLLQMGISTLVHWLRTCIVKDGKIYLQAGGGVADSVPENEFQESINKGKAILKAAEEGYSFSKKKLARKTTGC